jgi:hypothetical protein
MQTLVDIDSNSNGKGFELAGLGTAGDHVYMREQEIKEEIREGS